VHAPIRPDPLKRLSGPLALLAVAALSGCATLPPGSDYPKDASTAFDHPAETRLGRQFADAQAQHGTDSGLRLIAAGAEAFLVRMEMINAAERSLDLQYYIFHGDETGRLLTGAVLHAADRGVRVRILIDDAETVPGDEQITTLAAHRSIELRIFNPFAYRGHSEFVRGLEFTFDAPRLDYRMHNKLLVVDNALALVGGRNIGDQYFQMDPESQFADDDVFAVGPVVGQLSATFDEYWNSVMSIPVQALVGGKALRPAALDEHREALDQESRQAKAANIDYMKRVTQGEPFKGLLAGRLPLVWAHAQVVCDTPDKKKVESGTMVGNLMRHEVVDAMRQVQSELLMISPYLVPGDGGMRLLASLRQRKVQIRALTNSLESSIELIAHAGYMHYRIPLLEQGVDLYEIRSLLGNPTGSGETRTIAEYGNFALHAKLFVFDRQRVFIGSMNFDQRSMHLNTEIGLLIDSPAIAQQAAARFAAMTQPSNAYKVTLRKDSVDGLPKLAWLTRENGVDVSYQSEPARSGWQRFKARFLSTLPVDDEL
jgi:putative cardiolipin synthase